MTPDLRAYSINRVGASIDTLLNLQACDVKRINAQHRLEKAPLELEAQQKKVQQEKDALEAERKQLLELEVSRKDLDNQLKSAEDQRAKYKTQQIQVKKNEEYTALNNEIDTLTTTIDGLETQEISLLIEIDEAQKVFDQAELDNKKRIELLEAEIERIKKNQQQAETELESLVKDCEEAAELVPEVFLHAYKQATLRAKKAPFVVPIETSEHRCQGCHLKVSNEVFKQAYDQETPHHCDHCGRIVYITE